MPRRGRNKDVARDILPGEVDPYRDLDPYSNFDDGGLNFGEIFYSEISRSREKDKAKKRLRRKENSKKRK